MILVSDKVWKTYVKKEDCIQSCPSRVKMSIDSYQLAVHFTIKHLYPLLLLLSKLNDGYEKEERFNEDEIETVEYIVKKLKTNQ